MSDLATQNAQRVFARMEEIEKLWREEREARVFLENHVANLEMLFQQQKDLFNNFLVKQMGSGPT